MYLVHRLLTSGVAYARRCSLEHLRIYSQRGSHTPNIKWIFVNIHTKLSSVTMPDRSLNFRDAVGPVYTIHNTQKIEANACSYRFVYWVGHYACCEKQHSNDTFLLHIEVWLRKCEMIYSMTGNLLIVTQKSEKEEKYFQENITEVLWIFEVWNAPCILHRNDHHH